MEKPRVKVSQARPSPAARKRRRDGVVEVKNDIPKLSSCPVREPDIDARFGPTRSPEKAKRYCQALRPSSVKTCPEPGGAYRHICPEDLVTVESQKTAESQRSLERPNNTPLPPVGRRGASLSILAQFAGDTVQRITKRLETLVIPDTLGRTWQIIRQTGQGT